MSSSAAELEEEMLRAREDRMKRRSRIGNAASPSSSIVSPTSSATTPQETSEETLRRLMGSRGSEVTSPTSESPRRGAALLERYGGAMGPTGVAKPGAHGSPASLASFMGGKASGPRLGKLSGDGRNAPPEAELIDASRYALPGMVKAGDAPRGTSLASFLAGPQKASPISAGNNPVSPLLDSNTNKKDAATSPLKSFQVPAAKEVTPSATPPISLANDEEKNAFSLPAPVQSPSPSHKPQSGVSAAFLASQRADEKAPTASLTRLQSQHMVAQRVREAQERSAASSSDLDVSPSPRVNLTPARKESVELGRHEKTEEPYQHPPSPFKRRDEDRLSRSPPKQVQRNALPGLADRHAAGEAPRNLYAVNRKTPGEEAAQFAAPVRLPGMGGASSPFKQRSESPLESQDERSETLQPLIKGRVKPQKASRTVTVPYAEQALSTDDSSERISREAFANARGVFGSTTSQRQRSPERIGSTVPVTDNAAESSASRTRQDSATKLAESTAALEALLEGREIRTPEREIPMPVTAEEQPVRRRTGKFRLSRAGNGEPTIDTSAFAEASKSLDDSGIDSVDVQIVSPDGRLKQLKGDDAGILYERETRIVTFRQGGKVQVHAHVGRLSSVVTGKSATEGKTIMEYAKRLQCVPVDARQGRESVALVKALGGQLITREGSRANFDAPASCMYQARGARGAIFIDQVDMLTSSLYSGSSAIVNTRGSSILWHGKGVSDEVRTAARRYASSKIAAEHEEGQEDSTFWQHFDREAAYANAWHHQRLPMLRDAERVPLLWTVKRSSRGFALQHETPFSSINIRRDAVSILQLPLEMYVLVGPQARSERQAIAAALDAAQTRARMLFTERGSHSMTPPVHVVVFPSLQPLELRAGLRYFTADHLNAPHSSSRLRMNVCERREALAQLRQDEFDLAELDDETCLPVGVGPDDLKSSANV